MPTSMRTRALARLASARTCFMTDCLTEEESIVEKKICWRIRTLWLVIRIALAAPVDGSKDFGDGRLGVAK